MATASLVQVPTVTSVQASVDNVQVTTSAGTVQRQVVSLADPTTATNYATISSGSLNTNITNTSISTTTAGSTGTDQSPTKPSDLANLIKTIAVNSSRNLVGVQNQSAEQIQVKRDDGAGGNITYIILESGGSANTGGGAWTSTTFKGRIRIYSSNASSQVAAYED